jgi:cell division septal protein FtsQ
VSRGLLSPRAAAPALTDLGERSALITGQRVAAPRRRRPSGGRAGFRKLGLAAGVGLLLAAPLALTAWALTTSRFAVRAVEVRGASRLPLERIAEAAAVPLGVNLWRLDTAAVIARVEALPEVRRAEVVRELPNRVSILVEERRPFTLVHSGRLHWVDEEGRFVGDEREAVVPPGPVISGLSEDEVATMRTAPAPRARAAISLLRTLLRAGGALAAEISEIDMSRRDGPVLYTVGGIEVRIGSEDWDERLARLAGVLANVSAQGDLVRAIDLRFRDQVVLTKGGQG